MTAFVALLRGINVGGHKPIRMADLAALAAAEGFAAARTCVQSGNLVVSASGTTPAAIAAKLEGAIARRFGHDVTVVVRTAAAIGRIVKANPFPAVARADPGHLLVMFLAGAPTAADRAALRMKWDGPEEWRLVGSDLFITYPVGIGRSKLNLRLKTPGTGRNWKTVLKLAGTAAEQEALG